MTSVIRRIKKLAAKGITAVKKYEAEAPQRRQAEMKRLNEQLHIEKQKYLIEHKRKQLRQLQERSKPQFGFDGAGMILGNPKQRKRQAGVFRI